MSEIQLEHFIRYVALPTARLGLYVKRLEVAALIAPPPASPTRSCDAPSGFVARQGWWN
jgi:hypothetical protein